MTYDFSSRAEVVTEITEFAEAILDAGLADSIEEATAEAWLTDGGAYYELYHALPPDVVTGPEVVEKADRAATLREAIYEGTRHKALLQQLKPGQFSRSIEDLIDEVWSTPEGREVFNMYAGPYGALEATEALSRIEKSGQQHHYDDAIDTVREWLAED